MEIDFINLKWSGSNFSTSQWFAACRVSARLLFSFWFLFFAFRVYELKYSPSFANSFIKNSIWDGGEATSSRKARSSSPWITFILPLRKALRLNSAIGWIQTTGRTPMDLSFSSLEGNLRCLESILTSVRFIFPSHSSTFQKKGYDMSTHVYRFYQNKHAWFNISRVSAVNKWGIALNTRRLLWINFARENEL